MSTATASNRVIAPSPSYGYQQSANSTVNSSIAVGSMDGWLLEAIKKVIAFENLQANWDGQGSPPPTRYVKQQAIEVLFRVPGSAFPAPRVVPVSGGGYHLEWSVGTRELEVAIGPDCRVSALRVENGIPLDDEDAGGEDLPTLFHWLACR